MLRLTFIFVGLLAVSTVQNDLLAQDHDWPQFRGPNRDGISNQHGLLQAWPEGGPKLAWNIKGIGSGYGAPSVSGGRIFGMSNLDGEEVVWALAEKDGRKLWKSTLAAAYDKGLPQGKEGAGCSPTVDADRLYVLGLGGTLACLRTADGKVLWKRSLTQDFDGRMPMWRFNESPLVDGNMVVCTPGGKKATLVALDKFSGQTIWECTVPEGLGGIGRKSGAGYASAIAIDFNGQRQYVQLTATALIGVSARNGALLWQYKRPSNAMRITCSSPVHVNGNIFASSAYGSGGGMVRLTSAPEQTIAARQAYETKNMQNHHGGMVVVDGCLYGASGGNGGGFLVCLDFETGEVLWRERGAQKGSVSIADGRLFLRTETGTLILIEPNRNKYVERGRIEQPGRTGKPAWSYPVIANGKLYIRDQDLLLAYDIKQR